jgi:hypothetical protein
VQWLAHRIEGAWGTVANLNWRITINCLSLLQLYLAIGVSATLALQHKTL